MSHDVQKVRSFEHPGQGRKRAKSTPKGRQVDPGAAEEIALLLGDRPRRRDLLIEHLRQLELFQWFVRAHIESGGGKLATGADDTEEAAAGKAASQARGKP